MAKKNDRLVVNKVFFDLVVRKAALLDEMASNSHGGGIAVSAADLKDLARIQKDRDKSDASYLGDADPYVEPKAK